MKPCATNAPLRFGLNPMNSTEARLDHANGFKPKTLSARLGIIQFQIPRCAARRDTGLESWRTRPLETCAYVILGARYEKVRRS